MSMSIDHAPTQAPQHARLASATLPPGCQPPGDEDHDGLLALEAWLPDAQTLCALCEGARIEGLSEPSARQALERLAGAPSLDMLASPLGARASLMGLATGRAFVHHELRQRVPMPEGLGPELEVWEAGSTTPRWVAGALEEPKYFSFFQDAPLPVYNPNYRRKWRPHELLHGAVGAFWHPQMTRFELYLGARLNELLPVSLWYGLDELWRARCARHLTDPDYQRHCEACEQAALPFDQVRPDAAHRAWAHKAAQHSLDHLRREWDACLRELQTGRVCPTWHDGPHHRLDASSDAQGYVRGHWPRVTAWSFGAWAERFLLRGHDLEQSLEDLAARVARVLGRLLSGAIHLEAKPALALRQRRVHQDLAYRALLSLEALPEGSLQARRVEGACMELLDQLSQRADALLLQGAQPEALDLELAQELARCFETRGVPVGSLLLAQGARFLGEPAWPGELEQLRQGLESALPMSAERGGLSWPEPALRALIDSDAMRQGGPLAQRVARFAHDQAQQGEPWPAVTPQARAWIDLEAWLMSLERADDEAEIMAVVPDELEQVEPGQLRLNATASRRRVARDIAAELLGEPALLAARCSPDEPSVELLAARFRQEVRLIIVDPTIALAIEAIEAQALPQTPAQQAALLPLIEEGVLVWAPAPRGRLRIQLDLDLDEEDEAEEDEDEDEDEGDDVDDMEDLDDP